MSFLEYSKHFRDCVYGFIGVTEKELKIINSPAFQRLRYIRQLGNTYLVYPSANHTRFEHSIGVMHLAGKMAEKLKLDVEEIELVRISALLHDIGHGPFSHSFERFLTEMDTGFKSHEQVGKEIISTDETIEEALGAYRNDVINILYGKDRNKKDNLYILSKIISGPCDVDRMDYLLRDSHHCGVTYGHYDLHRILHCVGIDDRIESEIFVDEKGKYALESLRLARFSMFNQVYQHKTVLIADCMINKAMMNSALDSGNLSKFKGMRRNEFISEFLKLNDSSMMCTLLNDKCENSKHIADCLFNRRLFKTIFFKKYNDIELDIRLKRKIKELVYDRISYGFIQDFEADIAKLIGIDSNRILVGTKSFTNKSYIISDDPDDDILIKTADGNLKQFSSMSTIQATSEREDYLMIFGENASNLDENRVLDILKYNANEKIITH